VGEGRGPEVFAHDWLDTGLRRHDGNFKLHLAESIAAGELDETALATRLRTNTRSMNS